MRREALVQMSEYQILISICLFLYWFSVGGFPNFTELRAQCHNRAVKVSFKTLITNNIFFFWTQRKPQHVPSWCKNVQNIARTPERSDTRSEEEDELQELWWTCRSPSLLFLTKAFFFSTHPPSPFPSLTPAWGAARGPPDAYRQMSLVEQNTLCLTSQAATGLWRKLKGSLPCEDQRIKDRSLVLSFTLLLKALVQKDAEEGGVWV